MTRMKISFAFLGLVSLLSADQSLFIGTVVDSSGAPIAGATVSISSGGGTSLTATTNAQGAYSTTSTLNPGGSVLFTVIVQAGGYVSDTAYKHIPATGDGNPDTLLLDFALYQNFYHSLTIRGAVVDSAGRPLQGATVSLAIVQGSSTRNESAVSAASGEYSVALSIHGRIDYIRFSAAKENYSAPPADLVFLPSGGVVTLDTIRLTAIPVIDSLNYRVSGEVTSASGGTVSGAQVIVEVYENGALFLTETLYPSIGFYSASTGKIPRKQGAINAKVWVTAPGYAPAYVDTTVPWSQAQITVNVKLAVSAVLMPLRGRTAADAGDAAVYSVNGRYAAPAGLRAGLASGNGHPAGIMMLREAAPGRRGVLRVQ